MGTLLAILGAIASTALMIGATNLADKIQTTVNYSNKVDADTILNSINAVISEARKKGANALNIVNSRLNALQLPAGVSPSVKDIIMDKRRELSVLSQKAQKSINNVEQSLTNAEQRASMLAAQPESVRRVVGDVTKQAIIKDLDPARTEMDNISKEIENYVSKK